MKVIISRSGKVYTANRAIDVVEKIFADVCLWTEDNDAEEYIQNAIKRLNTYNLRRKSYVLSGETLEDRCRQFIQFMVECEIFRME